MNILSCNKISKTLGNKLLFDGISFGVSTGEKASLIGVNGSGKSSLLKLLASKLAVDEGEISFNNDMVIAYLDQQLEFKDDETIGQHIFHGDDPRLDIIRRYEECCHMIGVNYTASLTEELDILTEEMNRTDSWSYESEISAILEQLQINDLSLKMLELSGGMLKKVELAKTLIIKADLYLLDEPTNHLDIDTIIWLEAFLQNTDASIFMITHDRYFLDRICNVIYELDDRTLYKYDGNYSVFLEKKAIREQEESLAMKKKEALYKKELEWFRKMPKARGTKSKSRINQMMKVKESINYNDETELELSIKGKRLGKTILELEHISKSFDGTDVISDFSYTFKKGERLGLVGKNGSGKSTLLKIMTNEIEPDEGKINVGYNTKFGFFGQHSFVLDKDINLIDYIKETGEYIELNDNTRLSASQMLEKFLFPAAVQYSPISKLSGGEKRRLQLLKVLIDNPNFLLFDEPTNDLDITTLSILEDFLEDFSGCLIIVSHDRVFLDKLTDCIFAIEDDASIRLYPGDYTDYLNQRDDEKIKKKGKKVSGTKDKPKEDLTAGQKKLSYNEKKKLEDLESQIEEFEKKKTEIEEKLSSGEKNIEKLKEWSLQYDNIDIKLKEIYKKWEQLAEKA